MVVGSETPGGDRTHPGERAHWQVTLATSLAVQPVSPTIGAEITGWTSAPLAPEVVTAIRRAWTTHHVVFFRDQSLTADQQADSRASSAP